MANVKKRLIDVNELIAYFDNQYNVAMNDPDHVSGYVMAALRCCIDYFKTIPIVDAVEVVHGRWEDFCRGKMCCCSVCKAEFDNTCNEIHGEWYYCPNCGAKMDGDGNG